MANPDDETVEASGRGAPVALIVVAVVFAVFVLQNTDSVKVTFLVFDFSLPLWALILASAAVGVVIRDLVRWNRSRRD